MYDVGDLIPLSFTVVDPRTQSRTAATVTATIENPDGTTTELAATMSEVGHYTAVFVPTQPGRYVERWAAVNDAEQAIGARSDVINVAEGASAALISLAEAREHINIPEDEHIEDEELRGYIVAATAAVERHLNRVVARRSITEFHDVYPPRCRLFLHRAPLLSITSISTLDGDESWDPATMVVDSSTGMLDTVNGKSFVGSLKIVYVAGERVVPPNVLLATQIVTGHLWQTQRVAGPGFAGEGAALGAGFALPNRAVELLGGAPPVIA